jgi:hypothetical protein
MEFRTSTICRGCRHEFGVSFEKGLNWIAHEQRVKCPNCDSELQVQCQRDMFGMEKKVHTRTKMLKHTEKILELLRDSG